MAASGLTCNLSAHKFKLPKKMALSNDLLISLFCFGLSIAGFIQPKADAVSDGPSPTCNSNLREILPPPYSDLTSLACSLIWQQQFSFSFFQDSRNVTTFVISGRHEQRWIGIGFSRDGKMVGSSAMVAWVEKDGVSVIKQYHLEGKNTSQVIPNKGDLQFTAASPTVVVRGGFIYVAFQLQFAASLAFQPILMAVGPGNPQPNGFLSKHLNSTTVYIEFSSAHVIGQQMGPDELRRYHGVAAVISWGIMMPAGLVIARYFRHMEPSWYYIHSSTHFVGFFVGIISLSLGRNLYQKIGAAFVAHKFIGYTVFCLAGIEICQFVGRPTNDSKYRRYWNFAHYWVGRTAVVMGVVNIFVGFHGLDYDRGLKISFAGSFVTLLIMGIVFERRLRREDTIPKTIVDQPPVFRAIKS